MTPLLTTTEMAQRLGIDQRTLLSYRKRKRLREGVHYWQRGVGMERPRFVWDPEAVEQTLADPKAPRPMRQPTGPSGLEQLASYLLTHRYRVADHVILDCLSLGHALIGKPPRKIPMAELEAILGSMTRRRHHMCLHRLRQAGLIDYEPGTIGNPGYQFLRIGPVKL